MSASLVGSEMCIRDRFSGSESEQSDWKRKDKVRSDTEHNRPAEGSEPVSYTHLTLPTICSV
eukprot:2224944-Alexandrium_andersonii.AAC.1